MARCVIILQPLWILIKKNSKQEEEKHLGCQERIRNRLTRLSFPHARTSDRKQVSRSSSSPVHCKVLIEIFFLPHSGSCESLKEKRVFSGGCVKKEPSDVTAATA